MDKEALTTRVRSLTGIHAEALLPDDVIAQELNEAVAEVAGSRSWPTLRESTVIPLTGGQVTYPLPGDCRWVEDAVLSETGNTWAARLEPATRATIDRDYPDLGVWEGRPAYWVQEGGDLTLAPPPDSGSWELRIRYQQTIPRLDASTDTPPFRDDYHPMFAYGAAVRVLGREGDDTARTSMYQHEFDVLFQRLLRDEQGNHARGTRRLFRPTRHRRHRW